MLYFIKNGSPCRTFELSRFENDFYFLKITKDNGAFIKKATKEFLHFLRHMLSFYVIMPFKRYRNEICIWGGRGAIAS